MNKITRRFLSGASFFALSLGIPTSALKAGITVTTAAAGPVTVTNVQVTDFILVTGSGVVNGDILNEGFIISTGNAIEVGPSADVTGDIINQGFILAQTYGILVNSGHVSGNISNTASGQIIIPNTNMTSSEIAGIAVLNGDLGGIINDSGSMNVIGTGNFGTANGIQITNTGDLFATVHHGGSMLVVNAYKTTATFISVNAFGITAHAFSDMGVALTNSGKMTVTAVGGGTGFVSADAVGFAAGNVGNSDGASNNFAKVTNAGILNVVAAASGNSAWAEARAVGEQVDGGGGSQAHATFANLTSGVIKASAFAQGTIVANAIALGVRQTVTDATAIARASAVNDGGMFVFASAAGSLADASAAGIRQYVSVLAGGQVTAFAANNGNLTVIANAIGSGQASAFGVVQTARGVSASAQAASGHATFSNGGTLFVSAYGVGTSSANAFALGIEQNIFNVSGFAIAKMHNAGDVTVIASAIGETSAHAVATGLIQTVDPATGTALFTNTAAGSFKVTATAQAKTNATATAKGIGQFVTASVIANAYVFNSGLIDITAQAFASDTTPAATAAANAFVNYGIQQSALSADTVRAQISNFASATIDIGAHAFASAAWVATANAKITAGIKQVADTGGAGGSGSDAHVTLQNLGDIGIVAKATAEASWASANATIAAGISQFASAQWTATAQISNGGTIGITAQAIAHGISSGDAFAKVSYGIAQQAVTTDGNGVRVTLSNFGTIDIKALATATGGFSAVATALIVNGISQAASGSWDAQVSLYNSGDINILAHAQVTANSAYDVAKISSGFYQRAYGSGVSTALVTLSNGASGNITVHASAIAKGQNQATAWGTLNYGIAQYATSADRVVANLSNQGNIHLTAFAHATATNSAHAFADMVFGVLQSANGNGNTTSWATAELHNSGVLGVLVSAKATASGPVSATAHLSNWGIFQVATSAQTANVTLSNAGTIQIAVQAYAKGDAFAQAQIGGSGTTDAGIYQYAAGTSQASVLLSNFGGGKISIAAVATAIDTGTGPATAKAWIAGPGIYQIATGVLANAALHNTSGTIAIEALAFASAASGNANATALIENGIYQFANASGATTAPANASLTNAGVIDILAKATAIGTGTGPATAHASISGVGIRQSVWGATATAYLGNAGTINISALAYAEGDAAALAAIGSGCGKSCPIAAGIFQWAHAVTAANVTLNNSGSGIINIIAKASAIDTQGGPATATAQITQYGIYQVAIASEQANVKLSNTSAAAIAIEALAFASAASGSAFAKATIGTGIAQTAWSTGATGTSATALISNGGNITILASAKAIGTSFASAVASITEVGISQWANNADIAKVALKNSGGIDISALAFADGDVVASAFIQTGIYQSALGGVTASATLTNAGTINIVAKATAIGSPAFAAAEVSFGIGQFAYGGTNAKAFLSNAGSLNIAALAKASNPAGGGTVSAYAYMVYGVFQYASADSNTGSKAVASLINSGDLHVAVGASALGTLLAGTAYAQATLGGWGIYQQATNAENVAAVLNNTGNITIAAHAVARASNATAYAKIGVSTAASGTAIFQSASALNNDFTASVSLINGSLAAINIIAQATAVTSDDGPAIAGAFIYNTGIVQVAQGAGIENVLLDNQGGTIAIVAEANAHAQWSGNGTANAYIGGGINQHAVGSSGTASITLNNAAGGNIVVRASASATGWTNAKASATVGFGISQLAEFAATANLAIVNTGDITVAAIAKASASNSAGGTAIANIGTGIFQKASVTGASANLLINNSGKILIEAAATASGSQGPQATASVDHGISQNALNGGIVSAKLTGAGTVSVIAQAKATASFSVTASAFATVGTGIFQTANAATGGTSALASIDIGGGVIAAIANATGTNAKASATISNYGINQQAFDADTAKAVLENSGSFNIAALAKAVGTQGSAIAHATIDTGIQQDAWANSSTGNVATASLLNGGTLNIVASAFASGPDGATASASISNAGISQEAWQADTANAVIHNSGSLNIAAIAKALAPASGTIVGAALAKATMATGLHQDAWALSSTGNVANASLTVGKALNIVASAFANGASGATASATISEFGLSQQAWNGDSGYVLLDNSGEINIAALAKAVGGTGNALANATVISGLHQEAWANSASGNVATVSLLNGGTLNIVASAFASGAAGATASALISELGLSQQAWDAATAKAVLHDSGSLNIAALAKAVAVSGSALAKATIQTGLHQEAWANSTTANVATVSITVGTALNIVASAFASGASGATASATIAKFGISQSAWDAATAKALLSNSGSLNIAVLAKAVAVSGSAFANATLQNGLHQEAWANSTTGNAASVSIVNGGTLNIVAGATASGSSAAKAYAAISGYGISQTAHDGNISKAILKNSGEINIAALAHADGDVTATAFIQTGIFQSAAGPGTGTATASLTNAGTINIVAAATATGTPAYAIATLSFGIGQSALAATNAKAFLSSTGPLNIAAIAKASAPNTTAGSSAGAYAYMVYGVKQYASANGTTSSFATASLINSGDLAVVVNASAFARGTAGNAYAQATLNNWGIYQQATNAEDVSAVLDNSGDITILAKAYALGGGSGNANATALAQIGTTAAPSAVGIFQSASAMNNDFTASVSLLNGTGAINIVAQATARTTDGTGTALAQAFIYNTGILQVAQGAGVESIKLDNEGGTIAIAAIANAQVWSGAGTATALVGGGIYQHAVASSGTASIDLTNAGGNIVIVADADAAGWSADANAKATLSFGIGQTAQFAATATLAIANSGSITIAALAHAHYNPSTAKAVANIATGISQTAAVTGARAHLLINNSGKILIEAAATAEDAFWNATATATIGAGISQRAFDGSQVSAKLTGAGTVDIVAQAVATADISGASAFATIAVGIFQTANAVTGGTSALASISIGGGGVLAFAKASGAGAKASASITAYGIQQIAIAGSAAEDDFINASGAFTIGAIATATGTALDAVAHATIANGIYQFASATGSTFRASASIWNNPGATLAILASANAHGATKATASAYNYNAVYQSALGGKQAVVGIYNSGNVLIGAIAHADATGPAKAYAYMSTGVYQFASAAGGASNVATAVLSNSGNFTIIASAKATGTGTVSATATITNYGIYQQALNGDQGQANLNNSGTLNILAFAYAQGDVVANAFLQTGVRQTATGVVSATALITNTSLAAINIIAKATAATTAGGATATANAGITAYGIHQAAKTASAVLASISNAGVINIAALAKASATNTGAAYANATLPDGIYQTAVAGNGLLTAAANIFNSGTIAIVASAQAFGDAGASATATMNYGIQQYAQSANVASVALGNGGGGNLTIAALASATAATGFANAVASLSYGVYQQAQANAGSQSSALVSMSVGGGGILAVANAKGTAASANAHISSYGIYQIASSADHAEVDLVNSGVFNIAALANATATTGAAIANATVSYGIYQYAIAFDDRIIAAATIANSGTMAIVASAHASGLTGATAYAYNYYGIEQQAYEAAIGSVVINGGGNLTIAAIASAKAASGAASGYAYIGTGIYQYATASFGAQSRAVASISVGGGGILAVGNAKGTSADALAYINDYGIYQVAYYGDQALINLKNTGTFNIAAIANATATVNSASAYAYLNYGIYQYASAGDDRLTAAAIITNTGSLGIVASAKAVGVTNASASAYLYYGIQQYAYGAQKGTAALNGNGIVEIGAFASASAASGFASGYAYMYTGIYQSATAWYGSQTQAIAAIDVSGGGIFAVAGAKGTSASASAYIQYYGIQQYAYYGDLADVSLKNTGIFNIAAIASASANVKYASAYAYISYGIYQYASASGDQLTASVGITNSGTMAIIASAKAVGVSSANATAYLYYGIEQYAYNAGKGNAVIDGGGVLNIAAIAAASAVSGFASGYAFMYTGIYQSATATAGFTSANALIDVNGGGVMAVANAKGTSAYAYGSISSYGIYQYATGGDSVSAKLINSGDFAIAAIGNATGTANNASAFAYLYTGIYQYASAGNNELTAIASIDNSGTLAVIASAHAVGGTNAVATASITNYGIYQSAVSAGHANAKIVGGGIVTVAAIANATATGGPAAAYAFLSTGIYQYATASGAGNTSAIVSMSVGGGGVMAVANAKGTTANATASITNYGIYQYASNADYAAANFKNTGVFNIAALANATASVGFAFASATISTAGIYQSAYAGDDQLTAAANLTNSGTMAVIASAHAKGVTGASAIGYLNYGISQIAYTANDAGAELHNSGDLFIGAGAVASATAGAAFASALLVTGIYQYVYGTAGSGAQAHASITNTGALIVFAQASAKGTTSVSALASISSYGIYQTAFYGDTAKVAIQNSGTLAIEALAFASGDVFASAYIATGIYQQALATNNYVAATAAIGNTLSGVINIAAIATAIAATGSASASAYLSGYGIYQHAYQADTAVASIVNDGALAIVVQASASAVTGPAHAYAIIGTAALSGGGIYQLASAANSELHADAIIENAGSIAVVAQAVANGATGATASAYMLYGIGQYALGAGFGVAKLTGYGSVSLAALASATATSGGAFAIASIFTGIYQSVTAANGSETLARATVEVGGGMILAAANANGTAASALARQGAGIVQTANYGSVAYVSFANSGEFAIGAIAQATGTANAALATAGLGFGIDQGAGASNNQVSANAWVNNAGSLAIIASAQASGLTGASAYAGINYAVKQTAAGGAIDRAILENEGVLQIALVASAVAASGAAFASASIFTGIQQLANATFVAGAVSALALITNSGTLDILEIANASGTIASAFAGGGIGIVQAARGGETANASLKNSGVLDVALIANATAANGAGAVARLFDGINQLAVGLNSAVASLTNGGTLAVIASANALGGSAATASAAFWSHGISQLAAASTSAFVRLDNDGLLAIQAEANASAASGSALAIAGAFIGVLQGANGGFGDLADVALTNAKTLAIVISASAVGATAVAVAGMSQGVYQQATLAGVADISLKNSGLFDIVVDATASAFGGPASAQAFLKTGILQTATAFWGGHTSAFVSLSNAGTMAIQAAAHADGTIAVATASIASYGIHQIANGGSAGTVDLFNSGTLQVAAFANATAAKTASALAFIASGIAQFASAAYASNTAAASLTNAASAKLEVFAVASATGNPANASAIIGTGIRQSAVGADADFAFLSNSGTMNVAAIANASGDVTAMALMTNGIVQLASSTLAHGTAQATLLNSGKLFVTVAASAVDTGAGTANASAIITSHGVYQQAFNGLVDTALLENSGTLGVNAIANANGDIANALAVVGAGVGQSVNGVTGSTANARLTNATGAVLAIAAMASALGGASGHATANIGFGISQVMSGAQTDSAQLNNTGLVEVVAAANASGGLAGANASAIAINQSIFASGAGVAALLNAGTFIVMAAAAALGGASGSANAFASAGRQFVSAPDTAFALFVNSGTFEAFAGASATGNNAHASASAFGPQQTALGDFAFARAINSGTLIAQGVATAIGGNTAFASAVASGISQSVVGGGTALAEASNSGFYQVLALAKASGDLATAFAGALGVYQAPVAAGGATAVFINTSVFIVHAKATATGVASGFATAVAFGDVQFLALGGNATMHNAGTFVVSASANAFGATALAIASASGAVINGGTSAAIDVDVLNTGLFHVAATANDAIANAAGIVVTYTGTGAGGKVSGTIENDATMLVTAIAPGGTANALGIGVYASQFTGGIFNSGILQVYAKGASPAATAIQIGNGGATGATGTGTIENDGGTIWAGVSTGTVILRGTAIDVSGAPNAIVINLEGNTEDGVVFGNIKLSPNNDDTINFINGKTVFDGGINPDGDLFGTLNVGGGTDAGTMEFVHNPVEGQAYAYVDSYNQFADGTIFFHVDDSPDPDFVFIHANDASLDGTIELDFAPGLYADTTVYRIVLATNPITGEWDEVVSNFQSLFLTPEALYTTFEADIVLRRAPFTDFCQETKNNKSFTAGLENGYSPALTGPFADMIAAILQLDTEDEFCDIVDQLKGEEIGQTAFQNLDSAEILKDAVSAHLQAIWGGPEQLTEMRTSIRPAMGGSSGLSIWGGAYGKWGSLDRTDSGPGFDSSEHGLVGGADLPVGPNTLLGIAGSWTADGDLDFDNNNDGSYDGYQLGVYMRHNAGNLYLQALAAFGDYSNDTRRFVSIPGFGSGVAKGSFNSDVWQLYGEGGWHITTSGNVDLVPYAALHYLRGDSDAYTEKGFPGVNLHVSDVTATSFSSYLGARMAILSQTLSGGTSIVPTLKVAWQHEFEDTAWSVNAAFDGVPATAFHLTGDGFSKDSLIAGGELAISWGSNVDAVIDYEGRFNGDRHSNAIIGRLNFRL